MTFSIQNVGEIAVGINDCDLLVLMGMIFDETEYSQPHHSALKPYLECWRNIRNTYGPGTLDLELDSLAKDPAAKSELNNLLSTVKLKAMSWGETIPAAIANEKWAVRGVKFVDYQTSRVVLAIDNLMDLIGNNVANN
jgi:hypothetical protein